MVSAFPGLSVCDGEEKAYPSLFCLCPGASSFDLFCPIILPRLTFLLLLLVQVGYMSPNPAYDWIVFLFPFSWYISSCMSFRASVRNIAIVDSGIFIP